MNTLTVEVSGDNAVLVNGDAAHKHLVLDDALALSRGEAPDAARLVPAAGRRELACHRQTRHLVLVAGQRLSRKIERGQLPVPTPST